MDFNNRAIPSSNDANSPFPVFGNDSTTDDDDDSFCRYILYEEIGSYRVRIWDLIILTPNALFLAFLCYRLKSARLQLYATNSPIFLTFYRIIWICILLSLMRCVISIMMSALEVNPYADGLTDKIMWTVVRFSLLSTEMCVLVFGMAFGHLDSRNSIRAVLVTTCAISLVFSIVQGALEILLPNDSFHIKPKNLDLFGHGGIWFLLVTSLLFSAVYLSIFILPFTRVRDVISLPAKQSFYNYILILFLLSLVNIAGCGLLLFNVPASGLGLCGINFVNLLYYTLYIPLVYFIFLNELFGHQPTKIPFSYATNDTQNEDNLNSIDSVNNTVVDDDEYHFNSINRRPNSDNGGHNLTSHFVLNEPHHKELNPNYHPFLYTSAIQSPDSITGYSSVEESTATTTPHGSMEFMIPK